MKRILFTIILTILVGCAEPQNDAVDGTQPVPEPDSTTVSQPSEDVAEPEAPEMEEEEPMSVEELENTVVDLHTSKGTITIKFFPDVAPNHVRNFVELAKSGFYDGTKFHRIIPGFMIQGGDPNTKSGPPSTWGTGGSGKNVKAEFSDISHRRGIVSMARSNHPDSASSQFFIVVKDSTFLDNQYSVFGEVTSGMEVADEIVSAPRNAQDRPDDPIAIESVTVRSASDPAS